MLLVAGPVFLIFKAASTSFVITNSSFTSTTYYVVSIPTIAIFPIFIPCHNLKGCTNYNVAATAQSSVTAFGYCTTTIAIIFIFGNSSTRKL